MSTRLHLGACADGLTFTMPVDAITESLALIGRRGSGKTNTAVVLAEDILAQHHQVVIVDPEGVWWGLRSSSDGKAAGFPVVVFGGEHQDVPLQADQGGLLARAVVDHTLSCILDLSGMSNGEQQRFVTAFAEGIYEAKQPTARRTPVHVIIDEADRFAPQRLSPGQERMLGAVSALQLRARVRGVGITVISPRPAKLNKDVLNASEILIVHQVNGPHEKKALREWIEEKDDKDRGDTFLGSLTTLKVGCGWVWSPKFLACFERVQVRPRTTFDSSATPKVGHKLRSPTAAAAVDLDQLRARFAESVQQAEANDPTKLKAEVARLRRELAAKPAAPAIDVQAIVTRVLAERDKLWGAKLQEVQDSIENLLDGMNASRPPVAEYAPAAAAMPAQHARHATTVVIRRPEIRRAAGTASDLKGPERKLLTVLAQYPAGRSVPQLAILAGYSADGGAFKNPLGALRSRGLVENVGDGVRITAPGLAALGDFEPLPTGTALLDHWMGKATGPETRILAALRDRGATPMSRVDLAAAAGYDPAGGAFKNPLGRLRTLGLVIGKSEVRLADELLGA